MPPEKRLADIRGRLRHQSNKKLLKPLVDKDEESFDAMDLDLTQVMGPTQGHEKKKKGKRQVPPKDVGIKKNEQQTKKLPARAAKALQNTEIGTTKMSTRYGIKKQVSSHTTKIVPGKAVEEIAGASVNKKSIKAIKNSETNTTKAGPGPSKIFNKEFGEYGLEYEAETIKDSKIAFGERLYLVKWAGWSDISNTWEPEANLHNSASLIKEFYRNHPDKK